MLLFLYVDVFYIVTVLKIKISLVPVSWSLRSGQVTLQGGQVTFCDDHKIIASNSQLVINH